MAPGDRHDVLAADWERFRELHTTGRSEQALRLANRTAAKSSDPFRVVQAHIARLFAYHAAKNLDAVLPLLKDVEEQLRAAAHPRLVAQYHTLAAAVAYDQRSYGVALLHGVEAERALQRMAEMTRAGVDAWHDLAAIYTVLGYHTRAPGGGAALPVAVR